MLIMVWVFFVEIGHIRLREIIIMKANLSYYKV